MATETARWALIGAILGVIFFGSLLVAVYFMGPHYTDEQKIEINKAIDINCTKCLDQDKSPCTADTIKRTQWGVLCNVTWVKNCTNTCKRLT